MPARLLTHTPRSRLRRLLHRVTGRAEAPGPLRGRTVLVTGASSGIGEATARVLLVARRADELRRVQADIVAELGERLPDGGARVSSYACDLTDAAAVDDLVARVGAEHGAVDYLVNNAGRSIRRSLHLSYDRMHDVERTMAIN